MIKIIIALCAVLALAKGYENEYLENADRTDEFVKVHRLQNEHILEKYETKLANFREHYLGRVENIQLQRDFLIDSMVQNEERLNPLELLNGVSKNCVLKHRSSVTRVDVITDAINVCVTKANKQLDNLLTKAESIRDFLINYYKTYFDVELNNCGLKFHKATLNHTSCVSSAANNAHDYSVKNQKEFEYALEAAECDAKAHVKRAIDEHFAIQTEVIKKIAETTSLIDNCMSGKNECPPCGDNTCSEVYPLQADYKNETIPNPFFNHQSNRGCLMLQIV